MYTWVKCVPDRGNKRCKGPEIGDIQEANVDGTKGESSKR